MVAPSVAFVTVVRPQGAPLFPVALFWLAPWPGSTASGLRLWRRPPRGAMQNAAVSGLPSGEGRRMICSVFFPLHGGRAGGGRPP
eukprot:CAMPEP_0204373282 /NCGR_PEP_ID=MMETSP0469-20131031/47906_1 /ASSEMBLY_ACC=CAM_ASM_000384 /TAXON_ID=2969 /ORGANISM="Oxyrrhis marina" /LENGTH=84 /DNA_ID=CAMNT_0051363705 /DNA_START=256 /DNA_END=507 /DNA_ORIENTATION=+